MARVVMDNTAAAIGAIAFQLLIGVFGRMAEQYIGLGKTGNVFVFGEDKLLHNDLADTEAQDVLTAAPNGGWLRAGEAPAYGRRV